MKEGTEGRTEGGRGQGRDGERENGQESAPVIV